jgi:hypothetical protein
MDNSNQFVQVGPERFNKQYIVRYNRPSSTSIRITPTHGDVVTIQFNDAAHTVEALIALDNALGMDYIKPNYLPINKY